MKSNIILRVLSLLVTVVFVSGCGSAPASPEPTATALPLANSSIISAEGHVVPRDKVYLSFASAGHVEKILVEKGDRVQAGQVLAELDTTALQQIAVDQAQRHLLELSSPMSVAAAEQAVASARDRLDKAQDKADSLYYPRASDTLVDRTRGEIDLARKYLARTSDSYRAVSHLPDDDMRKATALVAMTNAQLKLNDLIAKYNWYAGMPTDIDAALIRSNLDAAKASLQEAEWYLDLLKGEQISPNATGSQLSQLKQAQDDLAAAKLRLQGTRLIAPFSGTVTDLNVSKGQFLGPETWVLLLADFSQWYVETSDLSEIEVVDIAPDQPVDISLESLPNVPLKGSVVSIAQNFSEKQGDIVYQVRVLLTDKNPAIRWGMTAELNFQR